MLGDDITVKFTALESAKISDSKIPKLQNDVLENGIVKELQKDARLNQKELAMRLHTSLPSVQRAMNRLKESGRIVRKGGKRFGYWEIN